MIEPSPNEQDKESYVLQIQNQYNTIYHGKLHEHQCIKIKLQNYRNIFEENKLKALNDVA